MKAYLLHHHRRGSLLLQHLDLQYEALDQWPKRTMYSYNLRVMLQSKLFASLTWSARDTGNQLLFLYLSGGQPHNLVGRLSLHVDDHAHTARILFILWIVLRTHDSSV